MARHGSCFSNIKLTRGSQGYVNTSYKIVAKPSYFILESPPRTQLLKWFSVLAESMTISNPGLFNNQTLISHRMVLLHFKSQFTIDIKISYSQNHITFEIIFTFTTIFTLKIIFTLKLSIR